MTRHDALFPRASGIILHPTSLPGPHGIGDLGTGARQFVDWLPNGTYDPDDFNPKLAEVVLRSIRV